jgi:hypothetical protein
LDGRSSYDLDGDDIQEYKWTILGAPGDARFVDTSSDVSNLAQPVVEVDYGSSQSYDVTLVVNDGFEDSTPDQMTIGEF